MVSSLKKLLLAVGVLAGVTLACAAYNALPDEYQEILSPDMAEYEATGEEQEQVEATAVELSAEPTDAAVSEVSGEKITQQTPTVIVIGHDEQEQGCNWYNYEIAPPKDTTSSPKFEIDTTTYNNQIATTFTYGSSGCDPQYFQTVHNWSPIPSRLTPGDSEDLWVSLNWNTTGADGCSALVAGASTSLEVEQIQLRVQDKEINVRTTPTGSLSDSARFVVPEGSEGDTFTITIKATTGSYGGVARYRFKYTCNPDLLPSVPIGADNAPDTDFGPAPGQVFTPEP